MISLIVVLLMIFTIIQISVQKRLFEKELERRIILMKQNLEDRGNILTDKLALLVEDGMVTFNISNVAEVMNMVVEQDKELKYAILMDYSRMVWIHTLRKELQEEILLEDEDTFAANQHEAAINEYKKDSTSFLEFIVPINVDDSPWGVLRLVFSLEHLNNEIIRSRNDLTIQNKKMIYRYIFISIVFVGISILIVLIISNKLSRPLVILAASARELAKGNFDIRSNISVKSKDEIGVLTDAFIKMSEKLQKSYEKLENYSRTLEQKVKERTKELKEVNEKLVIASQRLSRYFPMKLVENILSTSYRNFHFINAVF